MNFRSAADEARRASAIVPACNEERTVAEVVRALKSAASVGEVIVVDDGSRDRTADAARRAGADRVLRLERNQGKGGALRHGVAAASHDVLLFCDADLIGLTPAHIERLTAPVLDGRLAMCTGLRDWGPIVTRLIARLPSIAGERALRREIFEGVPPRFLEGFRVEIALGCFCRVNRLPYGRVLTEGVTQRRKMQKVGFFRGLAAYLQMIWQISAALVATCLSADQFRQRV